MYGQIEKLSDAIDVLLFDLSARADLGELAQRGHKGIANLVDLVVATYPDSVYEALKAEICYVLVLCLIENYAEDSEVGRPSVLEKGSDGGDIFNEYKLVVPLGLLQHRSAATKNTFPLLVKEQFLVGVLT